MEKKEIQRKFSIMSEPIIEENKQTVGNINKNDLTMLKSFGNPPIVVKQVAELTLLLMGYEPKQNSYLSFQKEINNTNSFIKKLLNFDYWTLTDQQANQVEQFLKQNPELTAEKVKKCSSAAHSLFTFCLNCIKVQQIESQQQISQESNQ